MTDVFVSYSRKDQEFVRDLVGALGEHGKDVWIDWKDIAPTMEFLEEIRTGIEGSDAFLFVISPDSADSDICRDEVAHAEGLSKRILPILRRDVDAARLPRSVALRQWIFFRDRDNFGGAVDELVGALNTDFEWARMHTELLEKALEWDRNGRDRSYLLRGTTLHAAEAWLVQPGAAEKQPPAAPLHSEYVLESRRASDRRQRGIVTSVTAALVVAVALALVALVQRSRAISERETAVSQLVASEALRRMDTGLDEALLLSVAAYRVKETPEARNALLVGVHRSQAVLGLLRSRGGQPGGAVFSPDERMLAIAAGREIRLWDIVGRKSAGVVAAGGQVKALSFAPDSETLAAAVGGRLRVWRLGADGSSASAVEGAPTVAGVTALAFSSQGELAVGTEDGRLVLWTAATGRTREFSTLPPGFPTGAPLLAVAFDPEGATLAAGGPLGLYIVDTATQAPGETLLPVLPDIVTAASFAGPTVLALVLDDERLAVWDVARSRSLCMPTGLPSLVSVAGDGRGNVAAGAEDGQVLLMNRACEGIRERLPGQGAAIESLDLSPSGREVVSSAADGLVVVRTTQPLPLVRRVATGFELVGGAAFAWQAPMVAVGGEGGVVLAGPDSDRKPLADAPTSVVGLASAPRARVLVAAGDAGSTVWTGADYAPSSLAPRGGPARTVSVALDPEGARIAEGTDQGTIRLRDLGTQESTGTDLDTGRKNPVVALAFSSRAERLAGGSTDGSVVVWELGDGNERTVVRESGASVATVAFDPVRDRLAFGDDGRAVTVWDLRRGTRLARLTGHDAGVTDVVYSPDGTAFASSDSAGDIIVWDAERLRPLGERLRTAEGSVKALDFDESGRTLAAASAAGTIHLLGDVFWEPEQAVARLCGLAARRLDERAWRAIVGGQALPRTCG